MLPDAPGARGWWAPVCWPHHALCVLRPHRACFVIEASLESSCSHLRSRVCSRVCCPVFGGWASSGRGWRKARWRLAHQACRPECSPGQRSVLLATLPQVWRAALHTDPALDTLEWLLGAAGGAAAVWRRSAAPPGAGAAGAGSPTTQMAQPPA